jgi:ankyrin repeat protein
MIKTLQQKLAIGITGKFTDAVVKKIDKDNYLDIHLPSVHSKKGTHLGINTSKDLIKVVYYCRDKKFNEHVLANSNNIEAYGQGLRIKDNPIFDTAEQALEAAIDFVLEIMRASGKSALTENTDPAKPVSEKKSQKNKTATNHATITKSDFQLAVEAFKSGDLEYVAQYVQKGNPLLQFNNGQLITVELISLVSMKEADLNRIKKLIEEGVDINERCDDEDGYTAGHFAAWDGKSEILELLLNAGANPNIAGLSDGKTPLHLASSLGHSDCVKLLIEHNADINVRDHSENDYSSLAGATPLSCAVLDQQWDVINLLIDAGADTKVLLEPCRVGLNGKKHLFDVVRLLSIEDDKLLGKYDEEKMEELFKNINENFSDVRVLEIDDSMPPGSDELKQVGFLIGCAIEALMEIEGSQKKISDQAEADRISKNRYKAIIELGAVGIMAAGEASTLQPRSIYDEFYNWLQENHINNSDYLWACLQKLLSALSESWDDSSMDDIFYKSLMNLFISDGPVNAKKKKMISRILDSFSGIDYAEFKERVSSFSKNKQNKVKDEKDEDIKEEDLGYPLLLFKNFENPKDELRRDHLSNWQLPSAVYSGRVGIRAFIPEWIDGIEKSCPKFSKIQLEEIENMIREHKIIPILNYAPHEFFDEVKKVWWIVPFCIWREDSASWVMLDKNGLYCAHPEDNDISPMVSWESITSIDIEYEYDGDPCVNMMTVYFGDDKFLTYAEFVNDNMGSYLSVVKAIYDVREKTIDVSRGKYSWKEGAGGEGFKSFENPNDLLKKNIWLDNPYRPDSRMFS